MRAYSGPHPLPHTRKIACTTRRSAIVFSYARHRFVHHGGVSTGDGRNGHVTSSDERIDLDLAFPTELGGTGAGSNS